LSRSARLLALLAFYPVHPCFHAFEEEETWIDRIDRMRQDASRFAMGERGS
jgi:hypothetical protein